MHLLVNTLSAPSATLRLLLIIRCCWWHWYWAYPRIYIQPLLLSNSSGKQTLLETPSFLASFPLILIEISGVQSMSVNVCPSFRPPFQAQQTCSLSKEWVGHLGTGLSRVPTTMKILQLLSAPLLAVCPEPPLDSATSGRNLSSACLLLPDPPGKQPFLQTTLLANTLPSFLIAPFFLLSIEISGVQSMSVCLSVPCFLAKSLLLANPSYWNTTLNT